MTDILTKAQRSALMAKVKGWGNASTELRLLAVFRALGITGWRRGAVIRAAAPRSTKALRASATSGKTPSRVAERGTRFAIAPDPKPFRVRPDFVFPKLRIAVFVDGCFWHGCPIQRHPAQAERGILEPEDRPQPDPRPPRHPPAPRPRLARAPSLGTRTDSKIRAPPPRAFASGRAAHRFDRLNHTIVWFKHTRSSAPAAIAPRTCPHEQMA